MDLLSRFGFRMTPFTREIRVEDCFTFEPHEEALDALERCLDERMSAALIAPAGTGKTTVLRRLARRLPEARYRVTYIKVAELSKRDLCRELAVACGAPPAGTYPRLVRTLQDHFRNRLDTDGIRCVIIIDDAHEFRPDVLGIIRILTNFDMDSRLVVSIVLAGQPRLSDILRREEFADIARRLAHYASLRLLSRDETKQYVEHRCTVAGAKQIPFDSKALDAIYEIGRGNVRVTDRLALKALEIAHRHDAATADCNHVADARRVLWP